MTAERGRRWLEAAPAGTGSSTALEPPAERLMPSRPGRDLPLQRTRATDELVRKQGGTVEYVIRISPLISVRGEIFFFSPLNTKEDLS